MATIGCNLLRVDHSINSKQDGVCIFYKEVLDAFIFKSLLNELFVKSLYKIARVMLALYIGLRGKIALNLEIFCQIMRNF